MVLMRAAEPYRHINDVGGPDAYPIVLLHGSPDRAARIGRANRVR
jgi:hypothetical protein